MKVTPILAHKTIQMGVYFKAQCHGYALKLQYVSFWPYQ